MDIEIIEFYKRKFSEDEEPSTEFVPSYGCCQYEPFRETRKKIWKSIYWGCVSCSEKKIELDIGNGIKFFACVSCIRRPYQWWRYYDDY